VKAYWFAAMAALFWGVAPVLEKLGLRKAPPIVALSIRAISVAVLLTVITLASGHWRQMVRQDGRTVLVLVIAGLCSALVGQLVYFHALKLGTPATVVPVAATYPLVAAALSVGFFGEPLTPGKAIGAVLVILGVLAIGLDKVMWPK